MTASIWSPETTPGSSSYSAHFQVATFTATEGQVLFNLPYSYTPGMNASSVHVNGVKYEVLLGEYTETSATSITLAQSKASAAGDKVVVTGGVLVNPSMPPDAVSAAALASITGSSLVGHIASGTGAVARTVQSKARDIVNIRDFGAVGDGVANDTDAIIAAINMGEAVYLPTGRYKIGNGIPFPNPGQRFIGSGRTESVIFVPTTFNLATTGVFVASGGEEGPHWSHLKIEFEQPDTAVRANLIQYPPAIHAVGQPRFTVQNLMITNAWEGIKMTGNSGGAFINLLEMSAYEYGIWIDGSIDSVRINQLQFWPFGMTANQSSIFTGSNGPIGLKCGRCDDLHLTDSLFINGNRQAHFFDSGLGSAFGAIVSTDFDQYASVLFEAGNISLSGCWFSNALAGALPLSVKKGQIRIANSQFNTNANLADGFIKVHAEAGDIATLTVSGCMFNPASDMSSIVIAGASGGLSTATIADNQFQCPQNTSPSSPVISVETHGRATITGNRISDKGTGTGTFISVAADNATTVANNVFVGWGLVSPSTRVDAYFTGNSGVAGAPLTGTYTPVVTTSAGPTEPSVNSSVGRYIINDKIVTVYFTISINLNNSGAGVVFISLPFTVAASGVNARGVGVGRELALTGNSLTFTVGPSGTTCSCSTFNNGYPLANGSLIVGSVTYQMA